MTVLDGLSPQQSKLVELLIENAKTHKYKTKEELLLAAGYSESFAKTPRKALEAKGVQRALSKLSSKMDNVALKTITALEEQNYNKLGADKTVMVFDKIMRNKALIQGQSTENVAINVSWS